MSRVNRIQNKILELDGGTYQKLLDAYLYVKYKFTNIQPLGVQTGTNKPTKGIPDSYVYTDSDKFVLICYGSVRELPADKIKKDILDCFNKSKLCLPEYKIEKIICGFTSSNIHIEEFEDLLTTVKDKGIEVELVSIGTLSHDLAWVYPNIAMDYLGIPIGTHQIFDVEGFVEVYDKNGMSSPLATKFYFRETKLEEVDASIRAYAVTVITGPSGIGKTRLALEVCRKFEQEGWNVFCVKSYGRELYDDLECCFDSTARYLLFLDDANEVFKLESLLKYLMTLKHISEVKILLTVRDYAKNSILTDVSTFSHNVIELDGITDDEIKEILKSNYGIRNPDYLSVITEVANGNIRLAILAGLRAIESGFAAIRKAEDIFKNYYAPIIEKVGLDQSELMYLCLIALSRSVIYKQDSFFQELKSKYASSINEDETLEKFHNREIVDWYEKTIAKISDQSFGNYILYHVIYEKKWIDLSFLIVKMIPDRREKIFYVLQTFTNLFHTDEMEAFIEENVNKAWAHADGNMEKYYVESFFSINQVKSLLYIKRYIEEEKTVGFDLKKFNIESNLNNNSVSKKEIDILTKYKRTEHFKDAIDLLLLLYAKRPDLFMDFFFAIKNNIMFEQYSYYDRYSTETVFLNHIWASCKNGQNFNNTLLYLNIVKEFLKTEFTISGPVRGRKFSWGRMGIVVCDEIKSLRNNIWNSLNILYDNPEYHDFVLNLMSNVRINGLEAKDRIELYQSDFDTIYKTFAKKETLNFDDTLILAHFKEVFSLFGKSNDDRFSKLETCHEYKVYDLLITKDLTARGYKEEEQRHNTLIRNTVKDYQIQDFNLMFRACHVIEKNGHGKTWSVGLGIAKVFENLETDRRQYINVVKEYLKNGAPFADKQDRIVFYLTSNIGYENTLEIIKNAEFAAKDEWLYSLWLNIPVNSITVNVAKKCINFQRQQLQNKENPIIFSILQIKRYIKYDKNILKEITEYLIDNPSRIHMFLLPAYSSDEVSVIKEVFKDNMDLLESLYFACDKRGYNLNGHLFWLLYKNNEVVMWEKIIAEIKRDNGHNERDYYRNIFSKIWKEPNYFERIDYAFKELITDTYGLSEDEMTIIFAKESDDPEEDKKKKWIWDKVDNESENLQTVVDLIDVVVNIYPSWKNEIVIYFLEKDKDVEHFKRINLFPRIESFFGSEIPVINKKIEALKELNSKIKGIDYIEHKEYLEDCIRNLHKYKNSVAVHEYIENGMY